MCIYMRLWLIYVQFLVRSRVERSKNGALRPKSNGQS